jgi:intraflagellar transport protein 122
LIAAAGAEVLVYDVAEGELVQALKAHKDTVYAVDYSADGSRYNLNKCMHFKLFMD